MSDVNHWDWSSTTLNDLLWLPDWQDEYAACNKGTILERSRSPCPRTIGASHRRAGDAQKDCV